MKINPPTLISTSVHKVFTEHVSLASGLTDRNGVHPCDGCEDVPVKGGGFSGRVIKCYETRIIDTSAVKDFRRAMARFRYCAIPMPLVNQHDTLEMKYIEPVLAVARRYFWSSDMGSTSEANIWYEANGHRGASGFKIMKKFSRSSESVNAEELVYVLFVAQGTVCWHGLLFPDEGGSSDYSLKCTRILSLIPWLQDILETNKVRYLILTDEYRVAIIQGISSEARYKDLFFSYNTLELNEQSTLRSVLGTVLSRASSAPFALRIHVPFRPVLGALSVEPSLHGPHVAVNAPPHCFSDFDLFTMQRHLPDLISFIRWKHAASKKALSCPLQVGEALDMNVDQFSDREIQLRFTLPLEKPPAETLQVVMKDFRARILDIDTVLARARQHRTDGILRFRVSKVVRSGNEKFSQVFFGKLEWIHAEGNLETSGSICLKLFDEALFPIPSPGNCQKQYEFSEPQERLLSLNFAVDMMRREKAVYDRLEYLQGTLLPHSYGFHQFKLPDGRNVYGFLMEAIEGSALSSFTPQNFPESLQVDLVNQIRRGLQAIQYAGVKQGDWHLDQILLRSGITEFSVVFIDFAFTWLQLGEGKIAEPLPEGDRLYMELRSTGFCSSAFQSHTWLPLDDYEC